MSRFAKDESTQSTPSKTETKPQGKALQINDNPHQQGDAKEQTAVKQSSQPKGNALRINGPASKQP